MVPLVVERRMDRPREVQSERTELT
jgi:hypothetical protein